MTALLSQSMLLLAILAAASEGKVEVRTERDRVEVGRPFIVYVEASGADIGEVKLPEADGLTIDGYPRRSEDRFTFLNGKPSQVKVRGYVASATRAGKIVLPPVTVTIAGKKVQSSPLTLTAIPGPSMRNPPSASQNTEGASQDEPDDWDEAPQNQTASPQNRKQMTIEEAIFLAADVDKQTVYQGEPVELTLSLWVFSGVAISEQPMAARFPTTTGFYAIPQTPEDLGAKLESRDGWEYRVHRQRQILYPTSPGNATIGPWEWESTARVFTDRGYDRVRVARATDPITITVKSLPERPKGFSGAVGDFSLEAELTERKVIQGTPTRLVVRVAGQGNPNAIGEPYVPDIENVYIAPPEKEVHAYPVRDPAQAAFEKTFVYNITPIAPGKLTIQPVEFCYFDPESEKFRTKRAGPFNMQVLQTPEEQSKRVVDAGMELGPEGIDVTGEDILPLAPRPRGLRRRGHSGLIAGPIIVIPVLIFLAIWAATARRRRFERDSGYARAYRARARARKRIRNVEEALEPADELCRALTGFVADKLNVAETGLTSADVDSLLREHQVGGDAADNLLKILRKCERARYAGDHLAGAEVRALLQGAAMCMDQLDAMKPRGGKPGGAAG